ILQEETLVQYIIAGEGEKPFALLLNALSHNTAVHNIPGVSYRKGSQAVVAVPYISEEEPPNPYSTTYFDALQGRIAYLETSRGCPYSCAFCLSGRCGSVQFFDLEQTKAKMLVLANSGTQTIKLVDRTFNANRTRAIELFRFIIQNYGKAIPKGLCFHFEIAGDLLDAEIIDLLATAPIGAMQFEIGLQSFNSRTLAAINRKTNVERLKDNIVRVVANGNMHIHIDLIAGLPYENLDSFKESFNTAYSLKPNMLQLGFLKILFGAPMRENAQQFPCLYAQQPPYEVYETPWISSKELILLHHVEDTLNRLFNSGRFRRTLDYLLKQTGDTPFELFSKFAEFVATISTHKMSLDDYTTLVFQYFYQQDGVVKSILRDKMVCDRLSTNRSGKLPAVLRIHDQAKKRAIRELEKQEFARPASGIKRGYALLYSEPCLVYVDYQHKNPISGEYPLFKYCSPE
ncbi:MAG: B12-binding domain-containing radical SAM protein, partial [Firmicutes bacterium]|nr:B12-binding domain-containing radical SAM protein [Bacillota bacterium]